MDVRAIRSRQAIIQAGLKLFIQNEDSTLVDIAKAADVGRATVYRQFKSREDLQESIGLYCLDRFDDINQNIEAQASNPMDAIRLVLQNILLLYSEFTFLSKFESLLTSSEKLQSRMRAQDDELRDLISLNLKQGFIRDTYSVDWVFFFFEGLLWAGYQAIRSGHFDPLQAAALAFHTFNHGVAYKEK
ncbi:TetR/AcrR family transcriptional regulator [Paraglaciecola sp.]|uniref:TetR/AcrR family transcriptional regulator n=1 Tax=Paraglaciecola sp. TaxID=1920173 RepID=UPI00273E46B1|nr:TetR/AcrR family transcriptional regulator [Paraglaciecola sp.]MBU1435902.1 TetR/AcrR family transcriptional regulator [Gammaproteobacteria bacterium]MBU2178450.1 TetR/AcrR family transcriptional regulator [Gammaproteobacteria bacterium]MBU2225376.1 TetR/AcrR family transcriptional regulator [Gammaproteobacteria bacterium]MBU2277958.1 TetR/AcrR family transcriptional regulator [Gammaproteobacteria bacterium]MBU2425285.1 TetR/AcrR family transcriptional regulator [Gammaproteobacteria bacteri